MTRWMLGALVALAVSTLSGSSVRADEKDGWIGLFNGKDLTGWKLHPSAKDNPKTKWEVVDGLLTGTGDASHVFTEGGDYTDFHYKIVAKISDKGNSGQYFRTAFGPGFPKGYEAQINATGRDKIKTGSLYLPAIKEVLVLDTAPHAPDEFFEQEVIAEGNHIIIKVNGKTTVDYVDPKMTFMKGHFAIQQHDPGSKVQVKSVQWKPIKK